MKTNKFNNRVLATLVLAFLCCVSVKAQDKGQWSLISSIKWGLAADFLYIPIDAKFHGDLGVTAKYSFNHHWSLLAGVEYEFRHDNSDNPNNWSVGELGPGLHHYFRVLVRVEFTHKWFYANFGPYLERTTRPWLTERSHEDFGFGTSTEVGGRIRLNDNSHLRLGLQNQVGFDRVTYHTPYQETEQWNCISLVDALFTVGYEVHF